MSVNGDMLIRISPEKASIVVEQNSKGVIARKNISAETLAKCFLSSRYDDEAHRTGLLPENCIHVTMTAKYVWYYIRYPELHADFTYAGTEYLDFPIPRLLFGFKYMPENGKVAESRVFVMKDEKPKPETPLFVYPFSNVSGDGRICIGNNALPVYKSPARLGTLASYILRIPNNNDHYSSGHNKLNLEYRDLLEQMKGKDPSHYYTDILVPSRKTLNDIL